MGNWAIALWTVKEKERKGEGERHPRPTIYYRRRCPQIYISSLRFVFVFIDLATVKDPPQPHSAISCLFVCLSHRMPFPLHSTVCFCMRFSPINFRIPFPLNLIAKKRLIRNQNKSQDFLIGDNDDGGGGDESATPSLGISQWNCMFIGVKKWKFCSVIKMHTHTHIQSA